MIANFALPRKHLSRPLARELVHSIFIGHLGLFVRVIDENLHAFMDVGKKRRICRNDPDNRMRRGADREIRSEARRVDRH